MRRVLSTLLMGERLISATVGSPEAWDDIREYTWTRAIEPQADGGRQDHPKGRTYRRGTNLSTLSLPCQLGDSNSQSAWPPWPEAGWLKYLEEFLQRSQAGPSGGTLCVTSFGVAHCVFEYSRHTAKCIFFLQSSIRGSTKQFCLFVRKSTIVNI